MAMKKTLLSALLAGGLFGVFQAQAMEAGLDAPAGERGYMRLKNLREKMRNLEAEFEKALEEDINPSRIKELEGLIEESQAECARENAMRAIGVTFDRLAAKAHGK